MTSTTASGTSTPASQWFASWFDSVHYHRLYSYRDDREAVGFIDGLLGRLRPRMACDVLDLGCGGGRHSRHLASKGFQVTGIDLAAGSIREARALVDPSLRFFQHDMRVPFGSSSFDCVFNFFTSFGYFENPSEHVTVVRNIADALRPDGTLVLDYLNVAHAESHLVPAEEKRIDGVLYHLTRWSTPTHFFKRILVKDRSERAPLEYTERVAKFLLADFQRMFSLYGLNLQAVYGDYQLNSYDAIASPRLILVVKKTYLRDSSFRMRLSVSGEIPRYEASIH